MKIKVSNDTIKSIAASHGISLTTDQQDMLTKNKSVTVDTKDPWWVVVLKVLAYLIGLVLAGVGTAEAANIVGIV